MTANTELDMAAGRRLRLKRFIGLLRSRLVPSDRPGGRETLIESGPDRHEAREVAASPLFDGAWYLTRYPDVAQAGFDPAQHYADFGEAEGRDASPAFSATIYAQLHPDASGSGLLLLHAERQGRSEDGRSPAPALDATPLLGVDELLARRFSELRPLPVFAVPHGPLRLSIVTDGIDPGRLRRGIGTAIIVAALTAKRLGAMLRIVTRTDQSDLGNVAALFDDQGIEWTGNMDLVHAPAAGTLPGIPVGSGDLFIATSWSTAWATSLSIPRARLAYFMHEDERLLYPAGDDRFRCSKILQDPELLHITESGLLLQSLQADGSAPNGVALGPFVSAMIQHAPGAPLTEASKRRFMLDATPLVPRSFYWQGLEALSEAIDSGALDPAAWDFYLTGAAPYDILLPGGARPIVLDRLGWADYAAELRRMDLGLCMLDEPHAWLNLAACGMVVVTGGFGPDDPNIIRAEPDLASLVTALREGARRAIERPRRAAMVGMHGNEQEWDRSAGPVIDRLASWAER